MPNRPLSRGLHTAGGQRKEASGETRTSPQGVQQGRRERPHAHAAQLHTSEAGSRSLLTVRPLRIRVHPSLQVQQRRGRACRRSVSELMRRLDRARRGQHPGRPHPRVGRPHPATTRASFLAPTAVQCASWGTHRQCHPYTGGSSLWLSAQNLQFSQNNGVLYV